MPNPILKNHLSTFAIAAILSVGCNRVALDFAPTQIPGQALGAQNRALGSSAFNPISTGESAYGRVAKGTPVTARGLFGSWAGPAQAAQANGRNAAAPASTLANNPSAPWNQKGPAAVSPAAANPQVDQRLSQFNVQNSQLYQKVAQLNQELQNTAGINQQLREQLKATTAQMARNQSEQLATRQRLSVAEASAKQNGFQGATIRANNSLLQNIDQLRVPGTTVTPDGDLVRIGIPSDYLFESGSYQLRPGASAVLDQLAAAVAQHYPRQILGIEAHWDDRMVGNSQAGSHRATTGQALTILDHLNSRSRLPIKQLFVMGLGGNRPKFANASPQGQSANRRIELVLYPEQF